MTIRSVIVTLAAISWPILVAQAPPPPVNTHLLINGDSAFVSFGLNGTISGSVNVTRCGTVQQPVTCLNYIISLVPPPPPPPPPGVPPPPPPPPIVLEQGDGNIPNADFTGSFTQGTFSLQTNTSASSNPSFHRGVGSGGVISIEFTRTNEMSQHTAGTSDTKYASGMKIHSSGE